MNLKYRLTALALCILLGPSFAFGYPIPPAPLWSLTENAELIVVAEVSEVEALTPDDDSWDSARAHLTILETLKGPEMESVEVPYAANMTCPAPARYSEGETLVAFLSRDKTGWRTESLSYGTLYPQETELEDMRIMIQAALNIQQRTPNAKLKERKKLEWLVQAAALPGTRWHGLYELRPGIDSIHSSYDGPERPNRDRLAPRHRALLAEAFVQSPKIDETLAMMLKTLGNHEDPRIDQVALENLEGILLMEDPPWWVRDLIWSVLGRFGDERLETRLEDFGVNSWGATTDQLRTLWSDAKAELGIPEVSPAKIDLEHYLPVGGQTPD